MFERTLIPVAKGEKTEEIIKITDTLANLGMNSAVIFNVHEPESIFSKNSYSWFDNMMEELEGAGLPVEAKTGTGHTASAIAEAAMFENADAVYMKTRRKWHIETMLLGSVSRDLLRMTEIPTFVHKVRPSLQEDREGIKKEGFTILYATDLGKASYRPLPYVKEFKGALCYILHIRDRRADPYSERRWKEKTDSELRIIEEELRPYYREVVSEQRIGNPATEVINTSERINADIVIMGRKPPTFFSAPMGSTAERIVNELKASIFLVP